MKKEYPDILKLEGEKWHNPDPATGKLGTRVPAEWLQTTEDSLKSLTLEMLEVLKAAGINPNELNNTQVRDAIQKMILSRVINYSDIQGRPIVKDSLGDDRNNPASQRVVNDVNRAANNAQTSANNANNKANAAQTRADSAYNLANSKQDKLTFSGTGNVARMSEVDKKRNISDAVFTKNISITAENPRLFLGPEGSAVFLMNNRTYNTLYLYDEQKQSRLEFPMPASGVDHLISTNQFRDLKLKNYTSQRSLDTAYTNDLKVPIQVIVVGKSVINTSNSAVIDGVQFRWHATPRGSGSETQPGILVVSIMPGSTYKIIGSQFDGWYETR